MQPPRNTLIDSASMAVRHAGLKAKTLPGVQLQCYYVFSPFPGKQEGRVVRSSTSLASYYN